MTIFILLVIVCLAGGAAGTASDVTDEEYATWPRLFHADDEAACLTRAAGAVYCEATFSLRPTGPHYNMWTRMRVYSSRVTSFDHTLLHRKYCLSPGGLPHLARRLSGRLRRAGLRARLAAGPRCAHDSGGRSEGKGLAGVLAAVVLANVVGTLYDVFRDRKATPNKWLESWSVPATWRRLTAPAPDPRLAILAPLDTLRILMSVFLVGSHDALLSFSRHQDDPRGLEKIDEDMVVVLTNATLMVELYVVMSSLVLTYPLLLKLEGRRTLRERAGVLPELLFNRIFRICPTYWAVLAAARAGGGERVACRAGGLHNVLLAHTLRGPQPICLLPSWFLATDLQLQVLVSSLVVLLPRGMLRACCLTAAAAMGTVFCLSYFWDTHEIAFQIDYEVLRTTFASSASFWWVYASWWGNAGAALCGAALATRLLRHRRDGDRPGGSKYTRVAGCASAPLCALWVAACLAARRAGGGGVALYSALARPVGGAIGALFLYAVMYELDPCWRWCGRVVRGGGSVASGIRVVSRSSLALSLLHWPVSQLLPPAGHVLSRAALSWVCSTAAAVVATVLLQAPAHALLTALRRRARPATAARRDNTNEEH